jgi:hypothetical protein
MAHMTPHSRIDRLCRLDDHANGERGAVMDVGGWLRKLGLEQYEAAFRENAISEKILPNLTAEDLKDLGVGLVGHRRMLLVRCDCGSARGNECTHAVM